MLLSSCCQHDSSPSSSIKSKGAMTASAGALAPDQFEHGKTTVVVTHHGLDGRRTYPELKSSAGSHEMPSRALDGPALHATIIAVNGPARDWVPACNPPRGSRATGLLIGLMHPAAGRCIACRVARLGGCRIAGLAACRVARLGGGRTAGLGGCRVALLGECQRGGSKRDSDCEAKSFESAHFRELPIEPTQQ
jgi:hypothetical protein